MRGIVVLTYFKVLLQFSVDEEAFLSNINRLKFWHQFLKIYMLVKSIAFKIYNYCYIANGYVKCCI